MLSYCSLILQSKSKTDTSAVEARNGKDIQGIPWERLNFTRDKYRETRLKQYKNYENLPRSREDLEKVFLLLFSFPKSCQCIRGVYAIYATLGIDCWRNMWIILFTVYWLISRGSRLMLCAVEIPEEV